jgi:tryptophan synthase alpha chain
MTHVVAGYPDLETSRTIAELLAANGADFIEIQIPFSDPLADGPTIMKANARALENGVRPEDCFEMIARLKQTIPIPLILMTYANIPFQMGWKQFAGKTGESGASGAIIPDLPFDEREGLKAWPLLSRRGIHPIPVLSSGMTDQRLQAITDQVSGFLYLTLRVGTTGAVKHLDLDGLDFIARVRRRTALPLAAGFGISTAEQVAALKDKVDIAVIGSRLIDVFDAAGLEGLEKFLQTCQKRIAGP